MSQSRIFSAIVVSVVLLAVAVPAAQARTLDTSPRVLKPADGSWLTAPLSWLAQLVGLERQAPRAVAKTETTTTGTGTGTTMTITIILRPNTGPCIDPNGCRPGS